MKKITLSPYSANFENMFKKEKALLESVLKNCAMHHIGSSAVPGLGGKGIIDILVILESWADEDETINQLKKIGFNHIHPKDNDRIFLSRIGHTQYGDTHLHVTIRGSSHHTEMLALRDYLRANPHEAERYFALKQQWLKAAKGDREIYTKLKEPYIREVISRVKGV